MSRLKRLVVEVHRRSLWQVLLIYAGGSWVVFEVVQTLTEGLGLPDWFPAFALGLLIVLLPVVLATAFVQEGGPRTSGYDPTLLPESEGPLGEMKEERGERDRGARRVLTWRNAILGGVVAFALLGVAVSGYTAMRLMGIGPVGSLVAKGVIERGERIVLADFENLTSDSLLAVAVTEALRTDLSQSRLLRLAEPAYLGRVLARMEKDPSVTLDEALAREVGIREGLRAVIAGEVSAVGTGYVLSARLVAAESGEVMAGWRETARDSNGIIDAIDRLSKAIRQRAGESLKSIRGSEPLERVTTGSLEALKMYSEGWRQSDRGGLGRPIQLWQQAIALDSGFAAAYRAIGVRYYIRSERAQAVQALSKAYELRDGLTERERYSTIGLYHIIVDGDANRALDAYSTLVEISDSTWGLNNLALLYGHFRDSERAERLYRRALLEADSILGVAYNNIFETEVTLGKFDEARRTWERWAEKLPGAYWRYSRLADLAAYLGDYAMAEAHIQARVGAGDTPDERLRAQAWVSFMRANLALLQGKLADARRHYREAVSTEEKRGAISQPFEFATFAALLEVWFAGDTAGGSQTLEAVLRRHPLSEMTPLDRPYLLLANFYALAEQPERARAVLNEYETAIDPTLRGYMERPRYDRVAGAVALAEGRYEESIRLMRLSDEGWCWVCSLALLGRAYDLAGQADSAVAVYERYVTQPQSGRSLYGDWLEVSDPFWLPLVYERLASLHADRGDVGKAVEYYSRLIERWKDADPELQPRVEAARRAIVALSPDQ